LRCAAQTGQVSSATLFEMVTTQAAALLRLPFAGRLEMGLPADLIVLPARQADPFDNLVQAERSALSLVMIGGEGLYGDLSLVPGLFSSPKEATPVTVDGLPKWLRRGLAQRLWDNAAQEPGLVPSITGQSSFCEATAEVTR